MLVVKSPKSQCQAVGVPVEVSWNCTVSGAAPFVGVAVKSAVSGVAGSVGAAEGLELV